MLCVFMRKILCLVLFSFGVSSTAYAQTPPSKDKPVKEAPKSETKKDKAAPIDLDAFFKKGEENAKKSTCDKPAKPADPIA